MLHALASLPTDQKTAGGAANAVYMPTCLSILIAPNLKLMFETILQIASDFRVGSGIIRNLYEIACF